MDTDVVARLRAAGCVFAEDEASILLGAARTHEELDAMVERRAGGEPLEYVVGWAEFCGLRVFVDPGVFVPRLRSEFLVSVAVDRVRAQAGAALPVIVDLCCGAGALGLAVAAGAGFSELHVADLDPAAVACARRNVEPAGGRVYQGDLFGPLPESLRGRVDILTANVPYIPSGELELLPPEARLYEPRVALDGGGDGLALLRRVAVAAPGWLAPGGSLLSEVSEGQAQPAREILRAAGLGTRVKASEEMNSTVLIATRYGDRRRGQEPATETVLP